MSLNPLKSSFFRPPKSASFTATLFQRTGITIYQVSVKFKQTLAIKRKKRPFSLTAYSIKSGTFLWGAAGLLRRPLALRAVCNAKSLYNVRYVKGGSEGRQRGAGLACVCCKACDPLTGFDNAGIIRAAERNGFLHCKAPGVPCPAEQDRSLGGRAIIK